MGVVGGGGGGGGGGDSGSGSKRLWPAGEAGNDKLVVLLLLPGFSLGIYSMDRSIRVTGNRSKRSDVVGFFFWFFLVWFVLVLPVHAFE